jgi:hypothetical protein
MHIAVTCPTRALIHLGIVGEGVLRKQTSSNRKNGYTSSEAFPMLKKSEQFMGCLEWKAERFSWEGLAFNSGLELRNHSKIVWRHIREMFSF